MYSADVHIVKTVLYDVPVYRWTDKLADRREVNATVFLLHYVANNAGVAMASHLVGAKLLRPIRLHEQTLIHSAECMER